ncbi:MAG: DEAD/DEAH box helicase [Deltaproteobacteria bacterium]|nr:DEAD/DEAH box helicase [Deltaproteobacteria bacterium]
MQSIFEAIQEACPRSLWSRGVELARADAVSIEEERDDEIGLRVVTRKGLVAPLVTLHPEDEDWQCSCSSPEEACEHAAAGVIALRRARKSGDALPSRGRERGQIVYELTERDGSLALSRSIESEGQRTPLRGSLTDVAAGRVTGPEFVATPLDLDIDRSLSARARGASGPPPLGPFLERLAGSERVRLDGQPIRVDPEPLGLVVRVVDAPGGVRVFAEQDPRIERAYRNDVVLAEGALHPLAPRRLSGRELSELPRGRFFADDDLAELVTRILPDLEERVALQVETRKLPRTQRGERPRMRIESSREGDALRILATLVYGDPPVARIDGGRLVHLGRDAVPIRDEAAEQHEITRLRDTLGLRPGIPTRLEAEEALAFVSRLAECPFELIGQAHHAFELRGELDPSLEIDEDRVALDFSLASDANTPTRSGGVASAADAAGEKKRPHARTDAVLRAWRRGDSVVALEGGGFARLPADWLSRYGDRLADLLSALDRRGRVARWALPDLARLCDDLDHPPPAALESLRPLLDDFEGIPRAPLPPGLEQTLRPYQREGVDWLVFLRRAGLGALLADDMGLGKTLQALCAIEGRTLVVAPTSVLHGWEREIERFRPELSHTLYHGPGRALDPSVDVTITSYALLRQDIDRISAERWDCVVLDEAQAIKNPESQIARAAGRLDAGARIALTGTPVENRLDELWSQLHFLNPGLLGGRTDFRERYARPIAEGDEEIAARLRRRIRPFLLRRHKSDVVPELPPLSEIVIDCDLTTEERAVYDSVRAATVREVVAQLRSGGSVMAALEALLRLRQAACHPALVPGAREVPTSSSKLEALYGRLEEAVADGHKALVFSQWTSLLDLVEPGLRERRIGWTRLDGSTRDRGAIVSGFQSDEGPPVMLLSLRAGGIGLNLTAADHVFLLDPWWNPAVEAQAADRAHRIGQDRPVALHRLIARDTVEEGILALHARKRALAQAALDGADGAAGLDREELVELLESA